jgi:hypothetical protein
MTLSISGVWKLKIDMSPGAIAKRLQVVGELRRTCLSLANSSAGKEILKKYSTNKSVQRTLQSLGRWPCRYT